MHVNSVCPCEAACSLVGSLCKRDFLPWGAVQAMTRTRRWGRARRCSPPARPSCRRRRPRPAVSFSAWAPISSRPSRVCSSSAQNPMASSRITGPEMLKVSQLQITLFLCSGASQGPPMHVIILSSIPCQSGPYMMMMFTHLAMQQPLVARIRRERRADCGERGGVPRRPQQHGRGALRQRHV